MKESVQKCLNAFGHPLTCRSIIYDKHSRYKEFVVEKNPLNYRRWIIVFVFLFTFSYTLRLYDVMNYVLQCSLLVFLVLAILATLHYKVQKESLLVISSIGVQLTTTFASGRQALQFIGNGSIDGFIINEGITMHCVLYYLAIMLRSQKDHILPLFQYTVPRLDFIQGIYKTLEASSKNN